MRERKKSVKAKRFVELDAGPIVSGGPIERVSRSSPSDLVTPKQWAETPGRHGMDAYLEDMVALRIQGDVDPVDDKSVRLVFSPDGRGKLVGDPNSARIARERLKAGAPLDIQPVLRPDESMLSQLMIERPPPRLSLPEPSLREPLKLASVPTVREPMGKSSASESVRLEQRQTWRVRPEREFTDGEVLVHPHRGQGRVIRRVDAEHVEVELIPTVR